MAPCHLVCLLTFMTFVSGVTGASLTASPSQITIGGSNPTSQLTVSCRPDAPGITTVFTMEIGKKSSPGFDQPIIRMTNTDSSVQVVDISLQPRMTASGSISGATSSIQFILTDLRCVDAASTYYCTTSYLTGSAGSDEATTNITARTYPEQIEMFPTPDRVQYDDGQLLSIRCTGRIGNQFDENNLQNLWTWEWRSVDAEFASWTRYPNDQNITYEPPTSSAECQYTGASTLVHTVSNLDNGRQFRCSVISADYSANKTVYVVGQVPISATTYIRPVPTSPTTTIRPAPTSATTTIRPAPTSATTTIRPVPTSATTTIRPVPTSATTTIRSVPTSATTTIRPVPTSATTTIRPEPTSATTTIRPDTKPSPPTDFYCTEHSASSVKIQWTYNDTRTEGSRFVLFHRHQDSTVWNVSRLVADQDKSQTRQTFVVTQLQSDTLYYFRLLADGGSAGQSEAVTVTCFTACNDSPAA
ncbi:mucin-5AC-like isoform X2 [Haliotis rubra]|uniref:mucin-5AC-like isoform X2 n=1 Tax=Haliotis rubra TaxID=36100 RepID=UPI001EE555FE|nr:mucin-5AC-like isoform X2 [Haliotis rubra]